MPLRLIKNDHEKIKNILNSKARSLLYLDNWNFSFRKAELICQKNISEIQNSISDKDHSIAFDGLKILISIEF